MHFVPVVLVVASLPHCKIQHKQTKQEEEKNTKEQQTQYIDHDN
jgi:hypothetical protein